MSGQSCHGKNLSLFLLLRVHILYYFFGVLLDELRRLTLLVLPSLDALAPPPDDPLLDEPPVEVVAADTAAPAAA